MNYQKFKVLVRRGIFEIKKYNPGFNLKIISGNQNTHGIHKDDTRTIIIAIIRQS